MQKSVSILTINLDILVEISSFLSAKDLVILSSTCSTLFKALHQQQFWISFSNLYPKVCPLILSNLKIPNELFYDFFKLSTAAFYSSNSHVELDLLGIDASSTDFNQNIDHVLNNDKSLFWSSKGHNTEDADEELLFQFKNFFVVPTVLSIRFFKTNENFGEAGVTYLSNFVQAELSMDGKNWDYTSEKKKVVGTKVEVKILKQVGIARFLKVRFIGKKTVQQTDNKYYHAVERVKAFGFKVQKGFNQYSRFNELILNGYINWREYKSKEENSSQIFSEDLQSEIMEYFNNSTFSKKYTEGLEELLKSTNFDDIWNYLQDNPMLLIQENTYIKIAKQNNPFVKEYLHRVLEIKKRDYLFEREITMALCDLLSGFNMDNDPIQRIMAIEMMHIERFKYCNISIKSLEIVIDVTGVGSKIALNYLLTKIPQLQEKIDLHSSQIRGLIYQFIVASTVLRTPVSNLNTKTKK